jgi:hypothetical protein
MPDIFVVPLTSTATSPVVVMADLVKRFRKNVLDEPYEDYSTGAIDATPTTVQINVNSPAKWAEGDIMEPRDSVLEMMKVRVGKTDPVIVKRAHNDSTIGSHALGVTLLKNPRFSGDEIGESLTRICYNLWPQAWHEITVSINAVSGTALYALPGDVLDLIRVTQDITPTGGHPTAYEYGTKGGGSPVLIRRDVPSTISATGLALWVPHVQSFTTPLHVTYRAEQTVSSVAEGLMADTVVMGAVSRVLGVRQIVRSGQDIRQAEPGMASIYLQDLAYFQSEYQRLLRRLYLQLMESSGPMPLWRL